MRLESVMLVPENARNLEKEPLVFEEDNEVALDTVEERRSPGEMLEDQGRRVEAQAKAFEESAERKRMSPGKVEKLQTGNFVVYQIADA